MDITIIIERIKETMKEYFPLKEDIPTKTSDLVNDNDFITNSDSRLSDALENKENISNKVISISSSSTYTQYPSAKCVYNEFKAIGSWQTMPLSNNPNNQYGTLYINKQIRACFFQFQHRPTTTVTAGKRITIQDNLIPDEYSPGVASGAVYSTAEDTNLVTGTVWIVDDLTNKGNLCVVYNQGWSDGSKNILGSIMWFY